MLKKNKSKDKRWQGNLLVESNCLASAPKWKKKHNRKKKLFGDVTLDQMFHHVTSLLSVYSLLRKDEYEFLLNMKEHFNFFKEDARPTLKQVVWIDALYYKYMGNVVRTEPQGQV